MTRPLRSHPRLHTCSASSPDARIGIFSGRRSKTKPHVNHPSHHFEHICCSFDLVSVNGRSRGWFSLSPFTSNPLASPADCPEKILLLANFPLQCYPPGPRPSSLSPGPKPSSSQQSPCFHSCPYRILHRVVCSSTCSSQCHRSSRHSFSGFRLHLQPKLLP